MADDRHDRRSDIAPDGGRRRLSRAGGGRPFFRRSLRGPRTVEAYLKADTPPAYMRRLRAIEIEFQSQLRRLESAHRALEAVCGHEPELFSHLWQAQVREWRFDRLNALIRDHNKWYPVEADLPMDPRVRDYVPVRGRSYRRRELGADWVLEHFPPAPRGGAERPRPPAQVPREPL